MSEINNKRFIDALTNVTAKTGKNLSAVFKSSGYSSSHIMSVKYNSKRLTKTFVDSVIEGAGFDFEDAERLRRAADYDNLQEAKGRGRTKYPPVQPNVTTTTVQKQAMLAVVQAYHDNTLDDMTAKMVLQIVKGAR